VPTAHGAVAPGPPAKPVDHWAQAAPSALAGLRTRGHARSRLAIY
jgi:hypothetical protein